MKAARPRLRTIDFVGNNSFDDSDLRGVVGTQRAPLVEILRAQRQL